MALQKRLVMKADAFCVTTLLGSDVTVMLVALYVYSEGHVFISRFGDRSDSCSTVFVRTRLTHRNFCCIWILTYLLTHLLTYLLTYSLGIDRRTAVRLCWIAAVRPYGGNPTTSDSCNTVIDS
jgi:hypothetical protein